MTQLRCVHFHSIASDRRRLHCLTLLGTSLLAACALQSAGLAADGPISAHAVTPSDVLSPQRVDRYTLRPEALDHTLRRPQESTPFRLLARGSERARIVNKRDEVVRTAAPGGTIFNIKSSPTGQWFLLYAGDAEYSVVSSRTLVDIARPPVHPDAPEDANGFGWFILDDDHLIGQADLPSLDTEGLTAAEVESLPPRDTLIYLYTISSNTMTPVEIDDTLSRPFHITGVSDGQIELLHYVTSEIFGARVVPVPAQ